MILQLKLFMKRYLIENGCVVISFVTLRVTSCDDVSVIVIDLCVS